MGPREIFLHHNKRKGLVPGDENSETIEISEDIDGNEIAEDMKRLRLWSEAQQGDVPINTDLNTIIN